MKSAIGVSFRVKWEPSLGVNLRCEDRLQIKNLDLFMSLITLPTCANLPTSSQKHLHQYLRQEHGDVVVIAK